MGVNRFGNSGDTVTSGPFPNGPHIHVHVQTPLRRGLRHALLDSRAFALSEISAMSRCFPEVVTFPRGINRYGSTRRPNRACVLPSSHTPPVASATGSRPPFGGLCLVRSDSHANQRVRRRLQPLLSHRPRHRVQVAGHLGHVPRSSAQSHHQPHQILHSGCSGKTRRSRRPRSTRPISAHCEPSQISVFTKVSANSAKSSARLCNPYLGTRALFLSTAWRRRVPM